MVKKRGFTSIISCLAALLVLLLPGQASSQIPSEVLITGGAVYSGEGDGDTLGWSASPLSDFNGDGFSEMIAGAPLSNSGGTDSGKVYLIPGGGSEYTGGEIAGSSLTLSGENGGDYMGYALADGGDLNDDGYGDILIGAPGSDEGGILSGALYILFGEGGDLIAGEEIPSTTLLIEGEGVGDSAGISLSGGCDVNEDGIPDLLAGAPQNDGGAVTGGKIYLITGRSSGWSSITSLSLSTASFTGENENGRAGESVAMGGDLNGDGLCDMVMGEPGAGYGNIYIVFGSPAGWMNDTPLSSSDAILSGDADGLVFGSSLAGRGDLNGDGYDDLLIGATGSYGRIYIVFGKEDGWEASTSPSDHGIYLESPEGEDGTGLSLHTADLNGDGFSDIVAGSPYSDFGARDGGAVHVLLGRSDGWEGLTTIEDADMVYFSDAPYLSAGFSVAAASDLSGDGYGAVAIGIPDYSAAFFGEGAVFLDTFERYSDGDGFLPVHGDCDDFDPAVYPGAEETPYNGIDEDCNGQDLIDVDGDGHDYSGTGGDDCNDEDPTIYSGAEEIPYNGIDEDCDSLDLIDVDGDGYTGIEAGGDDCDDEDEGVHPGAFDIAYNGVDENCDGSDLIDADGDGFSPTATGGEDCHDGNPDINPLAEEIPGNGVDENCDGLDFHDRDMDGFGDMEEGGDDCNDSDPSINPGAPEIPDNGEDEDCDGADGLDEDGDGSISRETGGDDCDDNDPSAYPGAPEIEDGVDNDCDGDTDEGFGEEEPGDTEEEPLTQEGEDEEEAFSCLCSSRGAGKNPLSAPFLLLLPLLIGRIRRRCPG